MTQQALRRKSPWLAATILLAVALLAPEWPGARIALSKGSVEIGRGEPPVWTPGESGDALGAGDRVRTGTDGKAEVTVAGATVRVYPNSLLRLPESAPQGAGDAVELKEGTSLFDVLKRKDSSFEVRTPEVVVSVKGTRFAVALDDSDASVSVFRGLVGVRGALATAQEMLVHPGFLAYGSDSFQLSWHGVDDPWESWSEGDLDSSPLHGERHEAALQDARFAALDLADQLPLPANQDPEAGSDSRGEAAEGEAIGQVPQRDPVADASEEVKNELRGEIIEDLVSGTTGPGGPIDQLLDIVRVDGSGQSGSDHMLVEDLVSGVTYSFEENELEDILDGDDSLPQNLLTVLNQAGIQPVAFTQGLLTGLNNGH